MPDRSVAPSRTWHGLAPILMANGTLLFFYAAGAGLASPAATIVACAAMLLFGLPHGTLDLEVLKTQLRAGSPRMAAVLLLYLVLAGGTYLLWQAAPVAALALFLVTAVVHFAEDWNDAGSAFFAQGLSVALLSAPALLHLADMKSLFVALSGRPEGAVLGDVMLLLAPVSLAVAAVALLAFWQTGRRDRAGVGIAVLVGMVLLPPAVGFASFFCLYHSPRHFRAALAGLSVDQFRRRWRYVVPLTLAAFGIAAWLFVGEARGGISAQAVAASFMTLSILTVPHMLVPEIVGLFPSQPRRVRAKGGSTVGLAID